MAMLFGVFAVLSACAGTDWEGDREKFKQARQALTTGQLKRYQRLANELKDYPLHYYLRYHDYKSRIKGVPDAEVREFLAEYADAPLAKMLRRSWLVHLAGQGDWKSFLEIYVPQKRTVLKCHHALARIELKQEPARALEDAKQLWLAGKSQPAACDPLFKHLYASSLMDDDLVWERIRLAMYKKNLGLARFLAKRLKVQSSRQWAARWQAMHQAPEKALKKFADKDSAKAREILAYGISRLAGKDAEKAHERWQHYKTRYAFHDWAAAETEREIALEAADQDLPQAMQWLAAIARPYRNEAVRQTRIKLTLAAQDWQAALAALPMFIDERNSYRWRYWQARALEGNGSPEAAWETYRELAKERDYYGFLAADRLGIPHALKHKPILSTEAEEKKLLADHAGILRAREFYFLKMDTSARREWRDAIKLLNKRELEIAAAMARSWCWYDWAIMTVAKAKSWDDLDVRFPTPFHNYIMAGADELDLDIAWVYGVIRQESAFSRTVRSGAGALGLMQLMPATAKKTAGRIGIEIEEKRDIVDIHNNIRLGTAYLRRMLDRFKGNRMLASAAYNAGPTRVRRWLAERGCLPADIWVELIPFRETRNYVRRVLSYSAIFNMKLNGKIHSMGLTEIPKELCAPRKERVLTRNNATISPGRVTKQR
ncbi:MAG: transglycosylase SLT domain-containing protein [Gammaproteobacteria bacterium]|nr:transglycosylase SLT domain-containing protein [Gammaproteobacteria bacterium]